MIEEDYCSYEVAKLLKDKGFNDPFTHMFINKDNVKFDCSSSGVVPKETIVCPTHQIAMKWLREVHNMYYEIQLLLGEKAEKYGGFKLDIYQLSSSGSYVWKDWIYADTYVELYENYIKYCLENLI